MLIPNTARTVATVDFSAAAPVTKSIPRAKIYKRLFLRLTGQLTALSTDNTAAKTALGDQWSLLSRIELKYGDKIIYSVSGYQLWLINYYQSMRIPYVQITLGDGATANPAFDSILALDFWTPDMADPLNSALDTTNANVSDFSITITFTDFDTVSTSATAWTVTPKVVIYADELQPKGVYSAGNRYGFGAPFKIRNVTTKQAVITGATSDQSIDLPVNRYHRGFIIEAQTDGAPTPGLITNFKIESGGVPIIDLPESMVWQGPILTHRQPVGFERALNSGTGGYGRLMQSSKFDQTGIYFIDFCPDSWWGETLNTYGVTEFNLVPTTSATTTVNVIDLAYTE